MGVLVGFITTTASMVAFIDSIVAGVYLGAPPRLAHAAKNGVRYFSRPATENTAVLLDDPAPSTYSTVASW
jgi:hypothetical protein